MPTVVEEADVIRHLTISTKRLQPMAAKLTEFQLFLINRNLHAAKESKRTLSEGRSQPKPKFGEINMKDQLAWQ